MMRADHGTILAKETIKSNSVDEGYVTICRARRIEAGAAADRCCRNLGCRLQRTDGAAPTASAAASPPAAATTASTAAARRDPHRPHNGGAHSQHGRTQPLATTGDHYRPGPAPPHGP